MCIKQHRNGGGNMEDKIKVVIAEDEKLLRSCLEATLKLCNDIDVIGCASNGLEAFELCKRFRPNVILMDLNMPECDGVKATTIIKEKYPNTKIIILTSFNDEEKILSSLHNGADGYILKDISPERLVYVIRNVLDDLIIIHNSLARKVFNNIKVFPKDSITLTKREEEIIRLIVQGKKNFEIAEKLSLSEGRIKNIITDILYKFKLEDRLQLAVFASTNNIV